MIIHLPLRAVMTNTRLGRSNDKLHLKALLFTRTRRTTLHSLKSAYPSCCVCVF